MPKIRITRYLYEEPYHVHLVLEATNDSISTCFEYYCCTTDLIDIATRLEVFPTESKDEYIYEIGSELKTHRSAYYFMLKVFQVTKSGHCAIQLRTNNNQETKNLEIAEFSILAESAQINRLGALFRAFSKLEHEVLEWNVSEGHLLEKRRSM